MNLAGYAIAGNTAVWRTLVVFEAMPEVIVLVFVVRAEAILSWLVPVVI